MATVLVAGRIGRLGRFVEDLGNGDPFAWGILIVGGVAGIGYALYQQRPTSEPATDEGGSDGE